MKRIFDILVSTLAIVIISPLAIPIMIILRLTGEGKVFYIQTRVGKNGKDFGLYKFATMLQNSPNMAGGDITVSNDPRVLPVGRVLRKTKINELPQLLNVFKGDISIVGPRPLTPRTFSYYPDDIRPAIAELKPGLTGIGSVVFRDEEAVLAKSPKSHLDCYKEDIAPYKGALELWYKQNKGFWLDIRIMLLTALVIVYPQNTLPFKVFKNLPTPPPSLL